MKVAICFFGLHPEETWKNITKKKDKCLNLWKKNVFDINDCDIFIHSFSKKKDELLKYKPKDYLFEEEKNSNINFEEIKNLEKIREQKPNHNGWNLSRIKLNYYISYGMKKSVELMTNYEETNNFKYDIVLLSRIDVCWLIPLKLNELNTNKIYSAIWGKNNMHSENGLLGYWLISNSDNMKKIETFYNKQKEFNMGQLSFHRIFKKYVLTITNDIKFKYNNIENNVTHMDLQRYLYK